MFLFFFSALLLSFSAYSTESVQMYGDSHEIELRVQYVEKTNSGEQFIVDIFTIKPGELQELKKRMRFPTKELMEEQMLKEKRVDRLNDQPFEFATTEFATTESSRSLWVPQNQWSIQWEERYNDWVDENFDEEFFLKKNLATDCADAAILLRWIFARSHSLPMASTLAGGGVVFSHKSM